MVLEYNNKQCIIKSNNKTDNAYAAFSKEYPLLISSYNRFIQFIEYMEIPNKSFPLKNTVYHETMNYSYLPTLKTISFRYYRGFGHTNVTRNHNGDFIFWFGHCDYSTLITEIPQYSTDDIPSNIFELVEKRVTKFDEYHQEYFKSYLYGLINELMSHFSDKSVKVCGDNWFFDDRVYTTPDVELFNNVEIPDMGFHRIEVELDPTPHQKNGRYYHSGGSRYAIKLGKKFELKTGVDFIVYIVNTILDQYEKLES